VQHAGLRVFSSFRRLFNLERRSNLAASSPELIAIFGAAPTAAGALVTPETALRSPTTLASCRVIAEAVGSLPIHLYRRGVGGARERESEHPAATLVAGDWAPWAGGVETRTAMQFDALLHGGAYAQVVRVGGAPRELHRLDPRAVTHEIDDATGEPRFRVRQSSGGDRLLTWRDMLYVPTPGAAPGRHVCLIQLAREAIAIDMVMSEHQGRLFANGARPSGVFKYAKTLGKEALERLRNSFNTAHTGSSNSGRTLILEDGMEFQTVQFSSVDLQFLELRRFVIQEIARAFKVPGTLIGELDRATWRNVEELARQFLQFTLLPWLEVWQAALTRVLLAPNERGGLFVEFLVDDLLRADLAARFAAYRNAVGGAWLTPNEARRLDNRPPVEGGDTLIRQAGQSDTAEPASSRPDSQDDAQ
jgi:HK97 family phage portal protein